MGATYLEVDMANSYRGSAARSRHQTSFMPPGLAASLRRRARQLVGLVLLAAGLALALALASFDPGDPSFNRATTDGALNLLGRPGAYASDLLLQTIGIAGALLALVPAVWGWRLMSDRVLAPVWVRLTLVPVAVILAAIACAAIAAPESWPLRAGLGGVAGAMLLNGAVYRLNCYLVGYQPGNGWNYFPSMGEIMVTLGIFSLTVILYLIFVKQLPVLHAVRRKPA